MYADLYSWDPGDYQITNGYNISTACTSNNFSNCTNGITSTYSLIDGANHYHIGNYYNWPAAVASNQANTDYSTDQFTSASHSICPKGWQLPSAQTARNTAGMYSKLLYASGIITTQYTGTDTATWTTNGKTKIFGAPLYLIRSGYVDTTLYYVGTSAYYSSSTVGFVGSVMSTFYFNLNEIIPQPENRTKDTGYSVRCVARKPVAMTAPNRSGDSGSSGGSDSSTQSTNQTESNTTDGKNLKNVTAEEGTTLPLGESINGKSIKYSESKDNSGVIAAAVIGGTIVAGTTLAALLITKAMRDEE